MVIDSKIVKVQKNKRGNKVFTHILYNHNEPKFYGFVCVEESMYGKIVDTPQEEMDELEKEIKKEFLEKLKK